MARITVVIPHKDRFEMLQQTLKSVMYQSFKDWEVIIVDDYSDSICLSNIKVLIENNQHIKLIVKTNEAAGAPISRNIGLQHAKGQYVLFLDSDDVLAPFALEQRIMVFENANCIHAVLAPTLLFNNIPGDQLEVWNLFDNDRDKDILSRFTKCDTPWNTMSALWDKSFLISIKGWDETISSYQDWELHIRALLSGLTYKTIDSYDNFYRVASDDQSIASRFFDDLIVEGRFRAFQRVTEHLNRTDNQLYKQNLRSLVIRNMVSLIDHGKTALVSKMLDNYKVYSLSFKDIFILKRMSKDKSAWRYRRLTNILVKLFWKNLDYDPWKNQNAKYEKITREHKALTYDYAQLLFN